MSRRIQAAVVLSLALLPACYFGREQATSKGSAKLDERATAVAVRSRVQQRVQVSFRVEGAPEGTRLYLLHLEKECPQGIVPSTDVIEEAAAQCGRNETDECTVGDRGHVVDEVIVEPKAKTVAIGHATFGGRSPSSRSSVSPWTSCFTIVRSPSSGPELRIDVEAVAQHLEAAPSAPSILAVSSSK